MRCCQDLAEEERIRFLKRAKAAGHEGAEAGRQLDASAPSQSRRRIWSLSLKLSRDWLVPSMRVEWLMTGVVSYCYALDRHMLDSINMTRSVPVIARAWRPPASGVDLAFAAAAHEAHTCHLHHRVADGGDQNIVASAEADLACRIIQMPKAQFA